MVQAKNGFQVRFCFFNCRCGYVVFFKPTSLQFETPKFQELEQVFFNRVKIVQFIKLIKTSLPQRDVFFTTGVSYF